MYYDKSNKKVILILNYPLQKKYFHKNLHIYNKKQYEYRFKPYPGNYITRNELWGKRFNLLETNGAAISYF